MITVVHCKKVQNCEYIGRPNPLGNPFTHKSGTKAQHIVESREVAVASYRTYILKEIHTGNQAVINEFKRLKELAMAGDLNLGCWCSPQACHGDVVKDLLEKSMEQEQKKKEALL